MSCIKTQTNIHTLDEFKDKDKNKELVYMTKDNLAGIKNICKIQKNDIDDKAKRIRDLSVSNESQRIIIENRDKEIRDQSDELDDVYDKYDKLGVAYNNVVDINKKDMAVIKDLRNRVAKTENVADVDDFIEKMASTAIQQGRTLEDADKSITAMAQKAATKDLKYHKRRTRKWIIT